MGKGFFISCTNIFVSLLPLLDRIQFRVEHRGSLPIDQYIYKYVHGYTWNYLKNDQKTVLPSGVYYYKKDNDCVTNNKGDPGPDRFSKSWMNM